jgi:ureidoglycolate lyase
MSTMKEVKIKELTVEDFKPYGSYANMTKPTGHKMGGFHPDMAIMSLGKANEAAFSVTQVLKKEKIIDAIECHDHTGEGILPLDGDVLVHVAPASRKDQVLLDQIEVFRVPKGTLLTLRPGVWHCAPFAQNNDVVNVLVILPERTYVNDIYFYRIPADEQIHIVDVKLKENNLK